MLTSKFDQATSSGNTCIQFLDIKIDIRKFSGDIVDRVTPVPIPNTEVKPIGADDTAAFSCGKVGSRRIYIKKARLITKRAFFLLSRAASPSLTPTY